MAKITNLNAIREAIMDNRVWTSLAVVKLLEGETSHWELLEDDGGVLVDVTLVPSGEPVSCLLGSTNGVWFIPAVDSEVVVLIPMGNVGGYPTIVATVSDAPSQLTENTLVISSRSTVKVIADHIELGDSPNALDEIVVGSGVDPFTGQTYKALNSTSSVAKAKK